MSKREPVEWIEIDLDYCKLTFGSAPCTAALGPNTAAKCFNTFHTCADTENYDKGVLTYKLVMPRSNYPKGETTFPCLMSVSSRSATANIAGSDDELYPLGKRGTISARIYDFPYHDRFMDKYQSERISGDAQFNGIGYSPGQFGTFMSKLRSRNPNYANRPMRHCVGYLDGGVLVTETTRHFILTEMTRDTSGGTATIEGKDILKLADDDRAVAPLPSRGQLTVEIDNSSLASFDLNPAGVGEEYDASGFAAIGSELVSFTRSGDTITLTGRGLNGTDAGSHDVDDTFQQTFSPRNQRIDSVIYDLLTLSGVDPAFIPLSDWQDEAGRWASGVMLTTDIMKPTGVSKLIGELAVLGITIWWDDVDQEIKFLVNHPVDYDTVKSISDRNNIIESNLQDRDKDRLTEIIFNTVQRNPSQGIDDNNFLRATYTIDAASKLPQSYGDRRIKEIFCRWLNDGNDAIARIMSLRLLNRFKTQPVRYEVTADYRDDVNIADVVELTSDVITTPTGQPETQLTQVIKREDIEAGHSFRMTLQRFQFDQRYAYFTDNARPVYTSSTDEQKARGAYWVGSTEVFGDGGDAYRFI